MQERPIGDHALLGDTRTAALVSSSGSIDWMCIPTFEGPPIFDQLIGADSGGSFRVTADHERHAQRQYRRGSALLETRLTTDTGTGTRTEGMVVDVGGILLPQLLLVRRVTCDEGTLSVRVRFDPRLGLPGRPAARVRRTGATICSWGSLAVALTTEPDLHLETEPTAHVALSAGDSFTSALTLGDRAPAVLVPPRQAVHLLQETDAWWRRWTDDVATDWPYRDQVVRSLITLRLLTFSPSGAPVAAPTTSLPEQIGGKRNWDYRFSWVRDASIGVTSLLALGKGDMADAYMHWLLHAGRLTRPRLKVLYTLYGTPSGKERTLDAVAGYRGSRPVRTGNSASIQHQLDVYGWVLHAGWSMMRAGRRLQGEMWRALCGFADQIAEDWTVADSGVWEVRGDPQHYVHSKFMGWVGLGCALQMAEHHRVSSRRRARWSEARSSIKEAIQSQGFDPALGAYTRTFGSAEVDASLLLLPIFGFDDDDDRATGTTRAIRRALETGHGLVYRYRPGTDGLSGEEGAFLPCSFWLAEALAKSGDVASARGVFESAIGHANDVGLLSEEADPESGALLGNFPLSFTHATLIQAAASLRAAEAP